MKELWVCRHKRVMDEFPTPSNCRCGNLRLSGRCEEGGGPCDAKKFVEATVPALTSALEELGIDVDALQSELTYVKGEYAELSEILHNKPKEVAR